jgi:hypothetical protein
MMLVCMLCILVLPYFVFAVDNTKTMLEKVGDNAGYAKYEGDDVFYGGIGSIVNAFLGLLGVIFIILMIYGGFLWMTAGGEEDRINKATKTIHRAVLGLIILASSFMFWQFIEKVLLE